MKALRLMLFAFLIAAAISMSWQKENLLPTVDICRLFKDETKLRKPGTCDESIVCKNFASTQGEKCPKLFNKDTGKCVTSLSDKYCESPCVKGVPTFVSDKKNCNDWYQCNGKTEVSKGSCPGNQQFNQKEQSCGYDSNCVATYEFCDVAPKDVPFQDENNCHKYYVCETKGLKLLTCDTGKYFDKAEGKCLAKAQVDCYKHPYPENVCGDTKIAYRNRFVSDQATCRGYFHCKDLGVGVPDKTPKWGQCSTDEFFNPIEQACQLRTYVKCNEDRCDGRRSGEKEISGRKGCQHYLICGDNYTREEIYCGNGLYFDPVSSICTVQWISYPSCS